MRDTTWSLNKEMANKPVPESSWFAFFTRKTKACLSFDLGQPFDEQEQYKEKIFFQSICTFYGDLSGRWLLQEDKDSNFVIECTLKRQLGANVISNCKL